VIVTGAQVAGSSRHDLTRRTDIQENLQIRRGPTQPAPAVPAVPNTGDSASIGHVELTDEQEQTLLILEKVFGAKTRRMHSRASSSSGASEQPTQPPAEGTGIGIRYDRVEQVTEREASVVQFSGRIDTADGRQLQVTLHSEQERTHVRREEFHLTAGDPELIDPLVLDLDGNGIHVGSATFTIDLNEDGQQEQIARLASGDAFLVYDRNSNGQLDDGGELFGPRSGDGFAELTRLDQDGNGFIDEADQAFGHLRLGRIAGDGSVQLQGLLASDVGALSLQALDSPFSHKQDEQLLAQSRASAYFLHESDGRAGLLSQVDFVA
jgi:hypothetical protein